MEGLQARLDSFKKSKRVKNPNKPSSTTTLKWPHASKFKADPESLAEAGFFYDPSYDDPDNVTCFRCGKQLGGWEEEDDPHLIHWEKCGQTCCWAIVQCGLTVDMDKSGRFVFPDKTRLPNHKSMEKARLETFTIGKDWIHDKTKNHGANSKSMARAGFVYTPQQSGDDLATCFYCNVSLSGWDQDDDPMEEHRKRAIKASTSCPFIEHTDLQSTKPPSRATPQPTKPPSKSITKPPSRSTSRTKHQDVVMPTETFDGGDGSDAPKPRSRSTSRKSSAKPPKRKKRSTSRSGLKDVAEEAEDEQIVEAPPTTQKMTRSRSKSVARPEVTLQPDAKGEVSPSRKPSRSRAKSKAPAQEEPEEKELPRKSSRSKSKALPDVTDGMNGKSNRPSRKSSKPKFVEQDEGEEVQHEANTTKPNKTTKHKRVVSKAPFPEEESELDPIMTTTTTAKKSTIVSKAKSQPQSRPQNLDAKDLFDEDIVVVNDYVPPPSSPPPAPQPSKTELPPLFIPKREKNKKPNTPKPAANEGLEVIITVTPDKEKEQREPVRYPSSRAETTSLSVEDERAEMMDSSEPPSQSGQETARKTKQATKVVEVSSDEDIDEFSTRPTKEGGKVRDSSGPPTVNATQNLRMDQVGQVIPQDVIDVSMDNVQQADPGASPDVERHPAPSTPPRSSKSTFLDTAKPKDAPFPSQPQLSDLPEKSSEHVFVPPLSRLPFMPLLTLSEAELDMTVEDWIRYHIEVEQDRFKRDGERELERFRKKAEEVRNAIESL